MTRIIALVAGPGSGSKYLHSLIDGTDGIYGIPGYCMMYYYPHYNKIKKYAQTNSELIVEILRSMPAIYDTRIMPGSESLNKLGENGEEYLATDIGTFKDEMERDIDNNNILLSSKELFVLIHKVHYRFFKKHRESGQSMPNTILYHIHCDLYLKHIAADFKDIVVLSTMRKPSVNLNRRTESSILEADRVKLKQKDYLLTRKISLSKMAYFHYQVFKEYMRINPYIYFCDYDQLLQDREKEMKNIFIKLKLGKVSDINSRETFGGLSHKMRFYEKLRNKSLGEIIEENKKIAKSTPIKEYDKVYRILTGKKESIRWRKLLREIISIDKYEMEYMKREISIKGTKDYVNCVLSSTQDKQNEYNMNHGYYIYKWSTPKKLVAVSNMLEKYLKSGWLLKIKNAIYLSVYPAFTILVVYFLIKKKIYMAKTALLARKYQSLTTRIESPTKRALRYMESERN